MSTPGLRERKKQKTRWAIQEHALRLFQEQGYEQTTVDQIAAAAEISPSTFFRYFKTKEDVVLDDEYDPLVLGLIMDAPPELPPMLALAHAMSEAMATIGADERVKTYERVKLFMKVPALRQRALDGMMAQVDMLARALIARSMSTDHPLDEFAARMVASAFLGAVLVVMIGWVDSEGKAELMDLMEQGIAHLGHGLGAPAAETPNRPAALGDGAVRGR